mmetsp:Transcript_4301/g.6776  ORF Transcript_4301/g.6776 Transcript_4301/m.6776 type:complete len:240 (-) Transcript_4301:153-872(-)
MYLFNDVVGPYPNGSGQGPYRDDQIGQKHGFTGDAPPKVKGVKEGKDSRPSIKGGRLRTHVDGTSASLEQVCQMQGGHLNARSCQSDQSKSDGKADEAFPIAAEKQPCSVEQTGDNAGDFGSLQIQQNAKGQGGQVIPHGPASENDGQFFRRVRQSFAPQHWHQRGPAKHDGRQKGLTDAHGRPQVRVFVKCGVFIVMLVLVVVVVERIVLVVFVVVICGRFVRIGSRHRWLLVWVDRP